MIKVAGFVRATWQTLPWKPATFAPAAHTHAWGEITGKPSTFTPSTHAHSYNDLTDRPTIPAATPLSNTIGSADTVGGTVGTATTAARSDHTHPLPTGRLQLVGTYSVGESGLITLALGVRRYSLTISGLATTDRIVAALNGVPQNGSLQDVYVSAANTLSVGALVPTLGVAATVAIPIAIYKVT